MYKAMNLAALVMMAAACGTADATTGATDTTSGSSSSLTTGAGGGRGGHRAPPQEAIDACASLAADAACTFTMNGHTITGTCRGPADKPLACAPDRGPGGPQGPEGEHRAPPQEAIDACATLAADAACTFTKDGNEHAGTCRGPAGKPLACAPDCAGSPGDEPPAPPQEAIDACASLARDAACSVTLDGNTLDGTCVGPDDKPLACMPEGFGPPPRR
jgi:hypothetical protein